MEAATDEATFLAGADRFASSVLAAPDPYERGMEFMGFCMHNFDLCDAAAALYVIWGALTDCIDGPRADELAGWGYEAMRRAATEWLELPAADSVRRRAYLDRWAYDECGYRRPGSN